MPLLPAEDAMFEYGVSVLVIGAGACGLTAALAVHEAGADVIVLERDAVPSGSTSLSQGLIPAAGTRLQRERGIEDSVDAFYDDLMAKAKGRTDPAIARLIAETAGPVVDWLVDRYGLDLHVVDDFLYPGHSCHRMHGPPNQTGRELEQALLAAADRLGIDIVRAARAEDLYATPEGRVTAVRFRRPDGTLETIGCDALVLACNGFGANREMLRRHIPEIAEADYWGHAGNEGDAVVWGAGLGAATADMGAYQGHGSVAQGYGALLTWAVVTEGGIQVNGAGERFADESTGYSEFALEVLRQPGQVAWSLYDARCERPALAFEEYRELASLGAVKSADDVAGLAAVTGLPEAVLAATLRDVAACASGQSADRFGRDFTGKPALAPPYRAMRTGGALFHTQGGLVVDSSARVLREDGTPLPNLFAGGGAARGVSGPASWGYLAGNGLVTAVVLGRIAGQQAAWLAAR